jgi:hypothetical protein
MEEEYKYGKMAQFMKGIGTKMLPVGKEDSYMLMGINMRENGKMIKPMVM